jgi:UDP-N-acetylglucosamine:LPS N-acetylglucosamine transferase
MKILFLVNGLGEYTQAYAVAQRLKEKGEKIFFISSNNFLSKIITDDGFKNYQLYQPKQIINYLNSHNFDALFLCNSHTTNYLLNFPRPKTIGKVFSLDSNWLFNNNLYHGYEICNWIENIYVVFPKKYFESNLKENGGYYQISSEFKEKIVCPGFIPSGYKINKKRKEYLRSEKKIKPKEKVVLIYYGHSSFHSSKFILLWQEIIKKINEIISSISSQNYSIRLFNLSDLKTIKNFSLFSSYAFDSFLGMADLIVMHHGYGTLTKIFNNQIPVINFSRKPDNHYHSQYFELWPAIKMGAIKHFFYEEVVYEDLKKTILALLLDKKERKKIQENQKKIFVSGEKNLLNHFYKKF